MTEESRLLVDSPFLVVLVEVGRHPGYELDRLGEPGQAEEGKHDRPVDVLVGEDVQ